MEMGYQQGRNRVLLSNQQSGSPKRASTSDADAPGSDGHGLRAAWASDQEMIFLNM